MAEQHHQQQQEMWKMKLYVADQTPTSLIAFNNLKRLCEERLGGKYAIEVIDLLESPELAADEQILALPLLIRQLPLPIRRVIGDLSNTERVLTALGLTDQGFAAGRFFE